ncbi:MAG: hotdog domain-containing protein [Pseudoclavibacter sp.]
MTFASSRCRRMRTPPGSGTERGTPGSALDRFGRRLGLSHEDADGVPGGAVVTLTVTDDHLNGAGIAHGGLLFAALDEAVAVFANHRRPGSVLTTGTLHCTKPVFSGDRLEASVREVKGGGRLSLYEARLERDGELVALLLAENVTM